VGDRLAPGVADVEIAHHHYCPSLIGRTSVGRSAFACDAPASRS
jgi:hypothetical protein